MIDWKSKFDKIYCIHYYKHADRCQRLESELTRVGILQSGIFDYFYDYDSPFFEKLRDSLTYNKVSSHFINPNKFSEFKCSFSHYRCLKDIICMNISQASRVLIIEDDVVFLKDLEIINDILNNIPVNYDLCLFDKFCYNPYQFILNTNTWSNNINKYFRKFNLSLQLGSGACYAVNSKCASVLCEQYETEFSASDCIWNINTPNIQALNKCFAVKNLCIQKQYLNHNCHDFNTDLAYKFCGINTNFYG